MNEELATVHLPKIVTGTPCMACDEFRHRPDAVWIRERHRRESMRFARLLWEGA